MSWTKESVRLKSDAELHAEWEAASIFLDSLLPSECTDEEIERAEEHIDLIEAEWNRRETEPSNEIPTRPGAL